MGQADCGCQVEARPDDLAAGEIAALYLDSFERVWARSTPLA
jgi:hypothetical protein